MIKLTETQTLILSAAAQRPENLALPLPKGLVGAAAKMTVTKMIERGWLQEVDANLRKGEPLLAQNRRRPWHHAGGHGRRSAGHRDRAGRGEDCGRDPQACR